MISIVPTDTIGVKREKLHRGPSDIAQEARL